jgi:hypothetical protein
LHISFHIYIFTKLFKAKTNKLYTSYYICTTTTTMYYEKKQLLMCSLQELYSSVDNVNLKQI